MCHSRSMVGQFKKACLHRPIKFLHFVTPARSEVLKDFSVENLETIPSTFLSKFSSDIYLCRILNYWGSIFTLYLTWGAFSLVCFLSVFFFFLSFSIGIFFDRHYTLTDDSNDRREGRGNHYFSCVPLPPAHKLSFSSSRFLPLVFNQSICNYLTNSWWDLFSLEICILFAFSLMQLSQELFTLTVQIDTVGIWTHIKLTPLYYIKKRTL